MKKMLIFIFIACICTSCYEELKERMEISIANRTDSLHIVLFPNEKHKNGNLYVASEDFGKFSETEFVLSKYGSKELFRSKKMEIKPFDLLMEVFDSIHVFTTNKTEVIRFSHDKVIGYHENLFSETSSWVSGIKEYDESTNDFRRSPIRIYYYTFTISEEKLIK